MGKCLTNDRCEMKQGDNVFRDTEKMCRFSMHPEEIMKKITLILLCLVITFSLAACGKKEKPEGKSGTQTTGDSGSAGETVAKTESYPNPEGDP